MKRIRTLAVLVTALGLIYLAVAVVSLHQHQQLLRMFEYYGVPEEIWMNNPDISQTRGKLWRAFLEFSIVSVIVFIVGLGLYLAKEWARRFWLALALLLCVMHMARLVMDYRVSNLVLVERIAEVVLIGALAMLSWFWLSPKKSSSAKLRGDESAAT